MAENVLNSASALSAQLSALCSLLFAALMHQTILQNIVDELGQTVEGATVGRIFQLSRSDLAFDLRGLDAGFLLMSTNPSLPRVHLIRRTTREMNKNSQPLGEFAQSLRSVLGGAILQQVSQDESERVVRFVFERREETGDVLKRTLIAQMTGRSANLFILDDQGRITHAQRPANSPGQQVGQMYSLPSVAVDRPARTTPFTKGAFDTWSAAADDYYRALESQAGFEIEAGELRTRIRRELSRLQKLRRHLADDLSAHGDAEQNKRLGELLLANISSAERDGSKVKLRDFYAADESVIEIEIDEKSTLQAEAAKYFARYGKAKRAAQQVARRMDEVKSMLVDLEEQQAALERIVAGHDEQALTALAMQLQPKEKTAADRKAKRIVEKIPGVRRYQSSDGYEILVGRAARDNDHLTFRIGRAQDLWLHAADYPGSHVIVRNPSRKEIPQRTLIEAAQLAAKFSQAGADAKVNVHYTQQKFVSRIKGAAPGLVRLASFKTIAVEPREAIERI